MSRSRKKAWVKDRTSIEYNRIIRHRINQVVKKMLIENEVEIPNPKTIVNQYDICDYRWQVNNKWSNPEKHTRK
jgi:hypothetical protein